MELAGLQAEAKHHSRLYWWLWVILGSLHQGSG